jgi:hypothetical protein
MMKGVTEEERESLTLATADRGCVWSVRSIPVAICKICVGRGCAPRRTNRDWVAYIDIWSWLPCTMLYVIVKSLNTMTYNVVLS